ncbi:MAG: arylesterase [Parvibaculum sp.]|nr:arylesterase [Parvibaculum sp.]
MSLKRFPLFRTPLRALPLATHPGAYGIFALFYKQATAAILLATLLAAPAFADDKPFTIVAFGDSLTAGYLLGPGEGFVPQLQKALQADGYKNVVVSDAGVSGDTTSGGLGRLDWGVGPDTKAVILELGANDALRGVDPKLTRANLEEILARLQKRKIPVLLAGMLAPPNMGPDFGKAFNPIYPELAAKYGLVFYPFFLDGVAADEKLTLEDGMHPNAQGIAVMVKRILPKVETLIEKAGGAKSGN